MELVVGSNVIYHLLYDCTELIGFYLFLRCWFWSYLFHHNIHQATNGTLRWYTINCLIHWSLLNRMK